MTQKRLRKKFSEVLGDSSFGARSWVALFSCFTGILSIVLALVRYPYYPLTFAAFGIYFGSLVLRATKASKRSKLFAMIGIITGCVALLVFLVLWLRARR
jgi:hypothetical protein